MKPFVTAVYTGRAQCHRVFQQLKPFSAFVHRF